MVVKKLFCLKTNRLKNRGNRKGSMKTVVMDTNFLIEVVKNRIDLRKELDRIMEFPYKTAVIEGTIRELEKIGKHAGRDGERAKYAISIAKNSEKIESGEDVDKELEKIEDEDMIIATQDRELKRKLKTRIIVVRQKKYLQLI